MGSLRGKLFITAAGLLIVISVIAIIISYSYTRLLVLSNFKNAVYQESNALSIKIDSTYMAINRKISIMAAELRRSPVIFQMNYQITALDQYSTLKALHYSLISKLSLQLELDALYVVTKGFVAGYSPQKDISLYASRSSEESIVYSTAAYAVTECFPEHLPYRKNMVVKKISDETYLVAVINWHNVFLDWYGQNVYLFNSAGFPLYSADRRFDMEELRNMAKILFSPFRKFYQTSYFVLEHHHADYNLYAFLLSDLREPLDRIQAPTFIISLAAALILLISLIILNFYSRRLVNPLQQFCQSLSKISNYYDTDSVEQVIVEQRNQYPFGSRVFYYYALLFFPLLAITIICFFSYKQLLTNLERDSFNNSSIQSINEIEYFFRNQIQYSNYITLDNTLQNTLINHKLDKVPFYNIDVVEQYMNDADAGRNLINIKIYNSDMKLLYSMFSDEDGSGQNPQGYISWIIVDKYISLYKRINNIMINGFYMPYFTNLGYLEMTFKPQFLVPRDSYQNGFQCIASTEGRIIEVSIQGGYNLEHIRNFLDGRISEQRQGVIVKFFGQNGFYICIPIKNTNWYYISFFEMPKNTYYNIQLILFTIIVLFVLSVFIYIISNLFVYNILKYIGNFENHMRDLVYGQVTVFRYKSKYNEFLKLAENFYNMLLRLNNLNHEMQNSMLERMELEKRKTEAQILVLQTQINPHFLHNILATTIMLIKMGQNIRAVDILQATGKFFRTSIYSDKTIVTVREELEHVWAYINLQMIRFPDKINFITADDEEVLPLLMPKFVLQPIVENAIDHNAKSNKAITIGIKFKLEQNFVIIVYDNGIGMNREVLTETQDRIDKNIYSGHVGLVNINKRLQLCFGPAYGIKIESIENKGTSVFITIPRDV